MLERRLEEMQNNISSEYEHQAATVHLSRYMYIRGRASLSIRDLTILANLIDISNLSRLLGITFDMNAASKWHWDAVPVLVERQRKDLLRRNLYKGSPVPLKVDILKPAQPHPQYSDRSKHITFISMQLPHSSYDLN
jgi:hypothetical protein